MHYYKRNIGDYAKKAGRLTMLQHGAYTLLIDTCYDREQFPTLEEAIDWTWASSAAEIEAVEFVLRKFFTLHEGRYVQNRIQEEIDAYHEKTKTNTRIANERETKRKEINTKRAPTVHEATPEAHEMPPEPHEAPPNQEPITNNQIKEDAPEKLGATDPGGSAFPPDLHDPRQTIFSHGVALLRQHGESDKAARSFLGKYAGVDEVKLAGVIGQLLAQPKIEPKSYIAAAMAPKKRELQL